MARLAEWPAVTTCGRSAAKVREVPLDAARETAASHREQGARFALRSERLLSVRRDDCSRRDCRAPCQEARKPPAFSGVSDEPPQALKTVRPRERSPGRRPQSRGAGEVGDVAGDLMTPWASPTTDEMGETWPVIRRR